MARPFDRTDPETAREVFEGLFPASETRRRLLEILADTIERAHAANPDSWSVTLQFHRRGASLNVGPIFALGFEPDEVSLILPTREGIPLQLHKDAPIEPSGTFAALPDVAWFRFAPAELLDRWEEIREDHLHTVDQAAAKVQRTPYARSFSPAIVGYAEQVLGRDLPRPDHFQEVVMEGEVVDRVVSLVQRLYPDWTGFDHPKFRDEAIDYKRAAAAQARDILAEDQLRSLIEGEQHDELLGRLQKLARATNLLYQGTPSSGDLAVLHADALDAPSFCAAVVDLLYGDGPSSDRLERFSTYLDERELPNKWTFPTYLLFLRFPEADLFVKPGATRWFLKLADADEAYSSRPSGELYQLIIEHARSLLAELEPQGARDMIDVQSALFVAHAASQEAETIRPSAAKRREMESLFEEFVRTYLTTSEGQAHQAAYEASREQGRKSFQSILQAREAGEDVTDRVLLELLPHTDSETHRQDGSWIHVAPAIMGNVKGFFEAAGWRQPGDWTHVARAILHFVDRAVNDPSELEATCQEFAKLGWSRGFQTGMLTPILNALRPDEYLLVNNKSRRFINYLSGKQLSAKLTDYPELNRIGHLLVGELADLLEGAPGGHRTEDVFDAFADWLTTIRKFPFGDPQHWKIAPGEGAKYWEACLTGGFISIGWNELGDLTRVSREEFERRRDRILAEKPDWAADRLEQVWKFAKEIREGDKILANEGTSKVLGVGTVSGPYEFVPDQAHGHRLPVDWEDTRPRKVNEGGWRRTLIKLDRDKYKKLLDAPVDGGDSDRLTQRSFDLLGNLFKNPTRAYYSDHRDEFKGCVEGPFQDLMRRVVALLPEAITARMETERNLFSRIPKNDYGRGGAWPFYWGALYPLGGKRIEDAQLALAILHDRLQAGFFIGEYGSESRKRFLRNVARHQEQLLKVLGQPLSQEDLLFGDPSLYEDEDGRLRPEKKVPWRDWLKAPQEPGIIVTRSLSREEVVRVHPEALADQIAQLFQELFPLVLLCLSDEPLDDIRRYVGAEEPDDPAPELNEPFPIPECATYLRVDPADLERWIRAIQRKKQAVFYGPPGTGKTYVARALARHLIGGGDGFKELVQFHPSYAYEDFIQGIRPEPLPDGGLDYPVKRGRFLEFCSRAREREGTCVLIIDEINRANLSRVFGELMYLLEYRNESIPLAAGGAERFAIPENVRILGTMNTADRSIALVDHALRRRFAFLPLRPSYETLTRFHEGNGFDAGPLVEVLRQVNAAIADPHHEVGITFFLHDDLPEVLEDVWTMEILPYLEEYFFDQRDRVDQFRWEVVRESLGL